MNYIDPRFLKTAFEWKYKHREATHFNFQGLELPYENMAGKIGIFQRARENLPSFYRNEADFPATAEGNMKLVDTVLQKLYRHQDQTLEKYFAPATKAAEEEPVMVEEPTAAVPEQVATGAAAATMTGGAYLPSLPRAPVIPYQTVATAPIRTAGKNLASQTQIGVKKGLTKVGGGLSKVLGGVGRGLGGMLGGLAGGGGRFFTRVGLGGTDALVRFSNQLSRGSIIKGPPAKFWLILLGGFLLVGTLIAFAPAPQQQPPSGITPITGNLASCQFTRGDRNPPAESYKSPLLLGYFQQASQISTVPAQVLAAIARVESPTVTIKTDADLPALSSTSGCPRSQTGALGIMQLQPPSTRGYIQPAIDKGASYLGKTADQLTEADFCDLSSNIIIAAGFILKKLQLSFGIGDGNKWDPSWANNKDVLYKLAEGYYGCLEYGGPDPLKCGGPYNYGDDLWSSIQSCKPSLTYTPGAGSGILSCPLNNGVITVGSKEAGGHCSPGYQTDFPCVEPDVTGRATAIDLQGTDQMVFLPNIGGNVVNWLVEKIDTDTSYLQQGILVSGGYSVIARAQSGGKTYRIRFVHIESPNVQQGQLASSGTPVGPYRSKENHVHITIQEEGVFKPGDLYFNLCK